MRFLLATIALVLIAVPVSADTTMVDANTYKVDQGVAFSISNSDTEFFFIRSMMALMSLRSTDLIGYWYLTSWTCGALGTDGEAVELAMLTLAHS